MVTIVTVLLTCANQEEATTITNSLLEKKLVACVKTMPVTAQFLWKGAIDTAQEVLLMMDSIEPNIAIIEQEVRKLHSYETFVLLALPVLYSSQKVRDWILTSCTSN